MDEHALRTLLAHVKAGRLSRRAWLRMMIGLGLTAPMAAGMLAAAGMADAQPRAPAFAPARRGGGGALRMLYWQAPTILNPHLSTGLKDTTAARLFYEPLAAYDPDGNLVPILAADVPSLDNGGLAKDGTWVVWNLKKGVTWHADLQQYNSRLGRPDPKQFMEQFTSWRIASRENKWSGSNKTRWKNDEYDRLWKAADAEMDPVKRAAMFIRMNDLVVQNVVVIPLFRWNEAVAASTRLRGIVPSPWDGYLWNVASWHRHG